MHIKYQLTQEAETQIDRAWKGLDDKFGNNVTKIEAADNLKPKSDSSPSTSDASQLSSSLRSLHLGRTDSNSKTDNLATENQLHHTSTSHSGTSDVHSASSPIIQDSKLGKKIDLKADAGQNQVVIEGNTVTLDGTNSKIGENSGLSYTWKQVGGPKVRIDGSNTPIASFEAPKVSLAKDKLKLKFVLSIADSLGRNNDKDTLTVVVKHDPSVSPIVDSPSSTNNNDNKDRTASHAERNGHSNNDQVVDNGDNSKPNVNGKSEEIQNEEFVPSTDNKEPAQSTEATTDTTNSIG